MGRQPRSAGDRLQRVRLQIRVLLSPPEKALTKVSAFSLSWGNLWGDSLVRRATASNGSDHRVEFYCLHQSNLIRTCSCLGVGSDSETLLPPPKGAGKKPPEEGRWISEKRPAAACRKDCNMQTFQQNEAPYLNMKHGACYET